MSDQKQPQSPILPKLNIGKTQIPALPQKKSAESKKNTPVESEDLETVLLSMPSDEELRSGKKSSDNESPATPDSQPDNATTAPIRKPAQNNSQKPVLAAGKKNTEILKKPQAAPNTAPGSAKDAPASSDSGPKIQSPVSIDPIPAKAPKNGKPPFIAPKSAKNIDLQANTPKPQAAPPKSAAKKTSVDPQKAAQTTAKLAMPNFAISNEAPSLPPKSTAAPQINPAIAENASPDENVFNALSTGLNFEKAVPLPDHDDPNVLPDSWLEGNGGSVPRETEFSQPNLIPDPMKQAENQPPVRKNNVDLEINDNLPPELASVIAEYDREISMAQTNDALRECTIQLAIARILEYTGYEKLAYVRYLKALEANHFSRSAIHELRRIARAYNKTSDVITLLQSEIDTDISPDEQAILLEECALLSYFSNENLRNDAINMLYRAAALSPKSLTVSCTLAYLLLFEHRYNECIIALDNIISLTDNPGIQQTCHCLKGDLESGQAPGGANGLDSYLRTLEIKPGMLYAFQHAMCIFIRQQSWQTLYTHTMEFAKVSKDKTVSYAATILAGSIAFDLLSDYAGSATAYEQASRFNPSDTIPLELHAENLQGDPSKWKEYDIILARLTQLSSAPKDKAELTVLRAINMERNGKSVPDAINIMAEIVNTPLSNRLILEYYYELLKRDGRYLDVMHLTKKFIEMSTSEEASSRLTSLGCYCYDILKDYDEAEINFRNALSLDPKQRTAFEYLELLLRSRNDHEGLAKLYRARLDVTLDARTRASLLYTLATICEYTLNQPENAIVYYRLYREIYPDDIHAIHSLERLYQLTKSWKSLIEMLLIEKNSASSADERCELLIRISNVCRYKLNNLGYAATFLKQAKDENPKSILVFEALKPILAESRNWKELIELMSEQLKIQQKVSDQIITLNAMARIHREYLCNNKAAVECYEQILKLDQNNIIASTNLSTIYKETHNFAAYYELALDRAQLITQPAIKCRHLFKIAVKTLTLFNEPEQTISLLEMALSNDPTYTPAVFLLTLLYGAYSKINELVDLLQDVTNSTKNQSTKAACSMTLSYLYTNMLGMYENAIHPLELSLALDPSSMNARLMLIFSQFQRGQYQELAPLIIEGAQNISYKPLAAHYYNLAAFVAHIFPNQTNTFENEVTALKNAIEIDPDNIIANERLESMEPSRANLVPFIEKRIKRANQEERTELQLALVESIYPDTPQKSFTMICDIIEDNPTHLPALRVGANMAQKLNNAKLLCHFLALQAPLLENIPMRITIWLNAAKIARDQLNQPELAVDYFKQAFMLAPQRMDICDQLIDLLRKKHDASAIDSILQLHTRSISKEDQIKRYEQMAMDYLNEFNEPTQAAVKLRQILEIDNNNPGVLIKLAQIESSLQHWNEARNAFEMLLESTKADDQQKQNARLALASIYAENLDSPRSAIPLLQSVLTSDPNNIQALELMANIHVNDSKFNEALAMLLRLNNVLTPPTNIRALLQIANIYQTTNDTEKLMQVMRDAAELVQLNPQILYEVQPWVSRCKDPVIIRAFIEKLLELRDLPNDVMVDIYEFTAFCYAGPLHMRFEADKYAIAAANLNPSSLRTQLLAAKVFDPKEAMIHATAAANIAPLNPEPYQAMLQIAINSNRSDLQGRVEQQLYVLNAPVQLTPQLQDTFTKRIPDKTCIIDDSIIQAASTFDINKNILALLQLAAGKTRIFEVPTLPTIPLSSQPALLNLFNTMARSFCIQASAELVNDAPFVYGLSPENDNVIQFNATMLTNCCEAEVRFHFASAMTHYKLGTLPLVTLPYDNITMLVSGLLGLYDEKLTSPNVLSRVKSFLPRNLRRTVIDLISSRGIAAFQYDPNKLIYAANTIAVNIAHAFSANLAASVSALIRTKTPNAFIPQSPQVWCNHYTNTPYLSNLLAFNTSEHYSNLRQKMGIFLKMSN